MAITKKRKAVEIEERKIALVSSAPEVDVVEPAIIPSDMITTVTAAITTPALVKSASSATTAASTSEPKTKKQKKEKKEKKSKKEKSA